MDAINEDNVRENSVNRFVIELDSVVEEESNEGQRGREEFAVGENSFAEVRLTGDVQSL